MILKKRDQSLPVSNPIEQPPAPCAQRPAPGLDQQLEDGIDDPLPVAVELHERLVLDAFEVVDVGDWPRPGAHQRRAEIHPTVLHDELAQPLSPHASTKIRHAAPDRLLESRLVELQEAIKSSLPGRHGVPRHPHHAAQRLDVHLVRTLIQLDHGTQELPRCGLRVLERPQRVLNRHGRGAADRAKGPQHDNNGPDDKNCSTVAHRAR